MGSLRMDQGRCVEGSGPHNSHPAAKGATPGKGDKRPSQGAHGDHTGPRSEKEDEMRSLERLRNSGLHTGALQPLLRSPLLKQRRASPESPRWGLSTWPETAGQTTAQTQSTDYNTQHVCAPRAPSPPWAMQRLTAEDALEFTLRPRECRVEAALGLKEQPGNS